MYKKILTILILVLNSYWLLIVCKMFFADQLYKYSQNNSSYEAALAAKNLFPKNPHILMQAAKLAAAKNKINEAQTFSKLAIKTSPGEINFYKLQSFIYNTLAIKNPVYITNSIESLKQAATRAPTDPVLHYQLGNLYVLKKDTKQAILEYQLALELKPNYDIVMIKLAEVYTEQKEYSKANKLLESAIKINPANKEKTITPKP